MASRDLHLPPPCHHLQDYRSAAFCNGTSSTNAAGSRKPFRSLHRCFRIRPPGGRVEILRDADEIPRCASCGGAGPRLYVCLACAAVSCSRHAPCHAESIRREMGVGGVAHEIAVDVDRAELFCCACHDQVYDVDFDTAVVLAQKKASFSLSFTSSQAASGGGEYAQKRRRVEYHPWEPDSTERAVVGMGSSPLPSSLPPMKEGGTAAFVLGSLPWGLRGLNNLGSTCFMNSVLQAFLHTPPLRNYFLSDRHNRYVCQQQKSKKKVNGTSNTSNHQNATRNRGRDDHGISANMICLACDLDSVYSAIFSGDQMPYSPASFLYSWWQHASNLASYEQQDAHEFFISILDGLHEQVAHGQRKLHSQGNGDCCIAHKIFSGILRSDVTCTICGFTSTTYDPCIDISLDLNSTAHSLEMTAAKLHTCIGEANSALSSVSTLARCLEHFTRPERLGSDQKLFCQHCQVRQESLKQMSVRKLPLVTCFHIKRFEHSSSRKMSKKVDRYLQFPFSLDMGPYLSSSILRNRFGNRIFCFDGDDSYASTELAPELELFAVITHSGRLDAGHYITFLRLSNQWYRCDDAWITHVSENIVRAAQAYMLFYVQKMLFYKANENVAAS